jgi:ribosome-associated toxin RatA of RatAB toxin-antitoxin module
MMTCDEHVMHAPLSRVFELAQDVEQWPVRLAHYRFVRFVERAATGGGIVEMSANRPFGPINWPTWWTSIMQIDAERGSIRYRHIDGLTTGMDVEWSFYPSSDRTRVRIVHVWNGPAWPGVGSLAARTVIGPLFVHGIASRTLAGLARIAERS